MTAPHRGPGPTSLGKKGKGRVCTIKGCKSQARARGMCRRHDYWSQETGDPRGYLHVDEIAIDRACSGDRTHLTLTERRIAIPRMTARGMTAEQISYVLGITPRTVQRHRTGAFLDDGEIKRYRIDSELEQVAS